MSNLPKYIATLPESQQDIWRKCFATTEQAVEFRKEEIEQSIPARFEQQVARYPGRLAVKTRKYTLTYSELNGMANRVAQAILEWRNSGAEPVAVLLEKDAPLLAVILAVLKAGKFYVPLDPANPSARLTTLVENIQAGLIVTNSAHYAGARALAQPGCQVLNIDTLHGSAGSTNPAVSLSPDSLACILYTSGSTGQPKGVVQNHRNILHSILRHTTMVPTSPDDRLTLLSAPGFVGAVRDTFSALLNGAAVYPFDLQVEGIDHLADWLLQEEITMYRSVATVFRHFVSTLRGGEAFPKLRVIKLGSETLFKNDVELYTRHFASGCVLYIGMGTTETGTAAHYLIDQETVMADGTMPAGYAVEDTEILLLDEAGQAGEHAAAGEIAVKSLYSALGYWRQPDLTAEKFLPDPRGGDARIYRTGDLGRRLPDGCLVHEGRQDFQVKVRGYRVNMTELESLLQGHPAIAAAAVTAPEHQPGMPQLVAYVVPAGSAVFQERALRHFLQERLPAYMIPATFVVLDALPVTPTGKIDRRALPVPEKPQRRLDTPLVAPRTPVEKTLAAIWAEVLGIESVGIHDHFLDLGGHSLLATQVSTRLLNALSVDLPMQTLFAVPTVAAMALMVTQHRAQQAGDEELAQILAEVEAVTEEHAQFQRTDKNASSTL